MLGRSVVVVGLCAVIGAGCTSASDGASPTTASTIVTTSTTTTSTATNRQAAVLSPTSPDVPTDAQRNARAVGVRKVDWKNAYLPAAACGGNGYVEVRDGLAILESTRFIDSWSGSFDSPDAPPRSWVELDVGRVHYGDLDGDGREDVAIDVRCDNGGGMGSSQLAFASVIVRDTVDGPTLLGIIEPTQPDDADASHVPMVLARSIGSGTVTVHEGWYGRGDAACCPSGSVTTQWVLRGGVLQRGASTVEHPVHE